MLETRDSDASRSQGHILGEARDKEAGRSQGKHAKRGSQAKRWQLKTYMTGWDVGKFHGHNQQNKLNQVVVKANAIQRSAKPVGKS